MKAHVQALNKSLDMGNHNADMIKMKVEKLDGITLMLNPTQQKPTSG